MFNEIGGDVYGPILTRKQKVEIKKFMEESAEVYLEISYRKFVKDYDFYAVKFRLYDSKEGVDYSKRFDKEYYCDDYLNGKVMRETDDTLIIVYENNYGGDWCVLAKKYKRLK